MCMKVCIDCMSSLLSFLTCDYEITYARKHFLDTGIRIYCTCFDGWICWKRTAVICSQFAMHSLIDRFFWSSPECPPWQCDLTFIVAIDDNHQHVPKSLGPLPGCPVHLSVTECLEVVSEEAITP